MEESFSRSRSSSPALDLLDVSSVGLGGPDEPETDLAGESLRVLGVQFVPITKSPPPKFHHGRIAEWQAESWQPRPPLPTDPRARQNAPSTSSRPHAAAGSQPTTSSQRPQELESQPAPSLIPLPPPPPRPSYVRTPADSAAKYARRWLQRLQERKAVRFERASLVRRGWRAWGRVMRLAGLNERTAAVQRIKRTFLLRQRVVDLWRAYARGRVWLRKRGLLLSSRRRRRCLFRCLDEWRHYTRGKRFRRAMMTKADAYDRQRRMRGAADAWREVVAARREETGLGVRALDFWARREAARRWQAWQHYVAGRRIKHAMNAAASRLRRATLGRRALAGWAEGAAAEGEAMAGLEAQAGARLQDLMRFRALRWWATWARREKELRAVGGKLAASPLPRRLAQWRALHTWRSNVEARTARAAQQLRAAVQLAATWATWRRFVRHRHIKAELSDSAAVLRRDVLLRKALLAWASYWARRRREAVLGAEGDAMRRRSQLAGAMARWREATWDAAEERQMWSVAVAHDRRVTLLKATLALWSHVGRRRLKAAGAAARRTSLLSRGLAAWRWYAQGRARKELQWRMAVRHRYLSLLHRGLEALARYAGGRRGKAARAFWAYEQHGLALMRRALRAWSGPFLDLCRAQRQLEARAALTWRSLMLRRMFRMWRAAAGLIAEALEKSREARYYRECRVLSRALRLWATGAAARRAKREDRDRRVAAAKQSLKTSSLRRLFGAWSEYCGYKGRRRMDKVRAASLWRARRLQCGWAGWQLAMHRWHFKKLKLGMALRHDRTTILRRALSALVAHAARRSDKRALYDSLAARRRRSLVARSLEAWGSYIASRREKRRRYEEAREMFHMNVLRDGCRQMLVIGAATGALPLPRVEGLLGRTLDLPAPQSLARPPPGREEATAASASASLPRGPGDRDPASASAPRPYPLSPSASSPWLPQGAGILSALLPPLAVDRHLTLPYPTAGAGYRAASLSLTPLPRPRILQGNVAVPGAKHSVPAPAPATILSPAAPASKGVAAGPPHPPAATLSDLSDLGPAVAATTEARHVETVASTPPRPAQEAPLLPGQPRQQGELRGLEGTTIPGPTAAAISSPFVPPSLPPEPLPDVPLGPTGEKIALILRGIDSCLRQPLDRLEATAALAEQRARAEAGAAGDAAPSALWTPKRAARPGTLQPSPVHSTPFPADPASAPATAPPSTSGRAAGPERRSGANRRAPRRLSLPPWEPPRSSWGTHREAESRGASKPGLSPASPLPVTGWDLHTAQHPIMGNLPTGPERGAPRTGSEPRMAQPGQELRPGPTSAASLLTYNTYSVAGASGRSQPPQAQRGLVLVATAEPLGRQATGAVAAPAPHEVLFNRRIEASVARLEEAVLQFHEVSFRVSDIESAIEAAREALSSQPSLSAADPPDEPDPLDLRPLLAAEVSRLEGERARRVSDRAALQGEVAVLLEELRLLARP